MKKISTAIILVIFVLNPIFAFAEEVINTNTNTNTNTNYNNVDVSVNVNNNVEEVCELDVVSDATTSTAGTSSVAAYSVNPRWTASIPGATWIWESFFVDDPKVDEYVTFEKSVSLPGSVKSADLVIAADNSYVFSVNGTEAGKDDTEFNYFDEEKDSYNLASYLHAGSNTVSFTVKNWGNASSTKESNPAGLLYKLHVVTYGKCDTGNGGGEEQPQNHPPILTILGANPLEIFVDTPFIDPGATSTDAEDGDITNKIIVTGSVNASTTGTYTLTYTVTDSDGATTSANRTVMVKDKPVVPPQCEELTGLYGWYGKYYDYNSTHEQMELPDSDAWYASYGDPLGDSATWTADWYNNTYLKFSRVDSNLNFGNNFYPVDAVSGAEIILGHNYHFGVHWRAIVKATTTGNYAYTLTSDDDSWVYVDGDLKVDNSKVHAAVTKNGTINMTAGTHVVDVFFAERHTENSHMDFRFLDSGLEIRPYGVDCPTPPPPAVNHPPLITLLGANPFNVATDTPFIDPGATSTDVEDGDLTSAIVVTGSINASTTGTYTLTYTVTDSGGLSASTTRTVVITATTTDNGGGGNGGNGGGGSGGGSSNTGGGSSSSGGSSSGIGGRRRDITNLLASSGSVLGATTDCSYLRDYLRRDWNNDKLEVLKLQSFLNVFEHESLSYTGVFDDNTYEAVSRFQNKYFADILAPWGHTAPTGFVYILTKKKINEIYCNTSIALTSAQEDEIRSFNSYIRSLNLNASVSSDLRNNLPINLSDFVGIEDGEKEGNQATSVLASLANGVKDRANGIVQSSALKNLAVSLFDAPKGLKEISSTYLLILLGLILIAVFAPTRGTKQSITVLEKRNNKPNNNPKTVVKESRIEPPKLEDFEEPTPVKTQEAIPMGPASSQNKEESQDSKDKGFKGIIG